MKKPRFLPYCACLLALATGTVTNAAVHVAIDHNDNDHASADFKFKAVPSPAKNSAAKDAKFAIVDGDKDANSAELDALHDGKLPTEQDQPDSNFFFADDSEGGRIVITLPKTIDIKQFNTYSWHPDTRAAQVYNLYASDGSAQGFKNAPGKGVDPTTCGWKLIAKVDTRPKTGESGGQYGVSITDDAGNLGKFRYLLMDVSRTESDDTFGNTFYSEVDVIDANGEMMNKPQANANDPAVKNYTFDNGKYSLTVNTTQAPDLTDWANSELVPVMEQWYPRLVDQLPSPGFTAPNHFSVTFSPKINVPAYTQGNRITVDSPFMRQNIKTESKGAVIHEMVHVVQQYWSHHDPKAKPNPGWLVEGLCDAIRWYQYEPQSHGCEISARAFPKANYDKSYRVTANFLTYVINKYDKNLLPELNAAMREGRYSDDLWNKLTGKSVAQLNDEWKGDIARKLNIEYTPTASVTD